MRRVSCTSPQYLRALRPIRSADLSDPQSLSEHEMCPRSFPNTSTLLRIVDQEAIRLLAHSQSSRLASPTPPKPSGIPPFSGPSEFRIQNVRSYPRTFVHLWILRSFRIPNSAFRIAEVPSYSRTLVLSYVPAFRLGSWLSGLRPHPESRYPRSASFIQYHSFIPSAQHRPLSFAPKSLSVTLLAAQNRRVAPGPERPSSALPTDMPPHGVGQHR